MALSYVQTNGDGATTNFAVPFSYLDKTHVHGYVGGVQAAFTWVNNATIQFAVAPPVGVLNVEIKRITPRDVVLVDFNNGSVLFDSDLDTSYLQCLFILQEANEQAATLFPAGHTLDSHSDATPGSSTAKGTMRIYDANGKLIALLSDTDGKVLECDSTTPTGLRWQQGLRTVLTTAGDLLYASAAGVAARRAIGTEGQVLTVSAGLLPVWSNLPAVSSGGSSGGASAADIIDNGAMDVWQRGSGAKTNTGNGWLADRWKFFWSTATMNFTSQRSTSVPTVAEAGVLLTYSSEIKCDVVEAGFAAAEYAYVRQVVEGWRWRNFAQRQFTLSFWVYSTKTGTYCVSVRNGGIDRSYVAEFTINVSNTWEQKTIVIPASPSAGTWDYQTGMGLLVSVCLGVGANYQVGAGAWQTGNFLGTVNQVNFFDNTANVFRLTGVKTDLGGTAYPIQPLPFPEELLRCKRYYQKSFQYSTTPAMNSGDGTGVHYTLATRAGNVQNYGSRFLWQVPMRAIPALVTYNPYAANDMARDVGSGNDCVAGTNRDEQGNTFLIIGHAATSIGNGFHLHWSADADWN